MSAHSGHPKFQLLSRQICKTLWVGQQACVLASSLTELQGQAHSGKRNAAAVVREGVGKREQPALKKSDVKFLRMQITELV